MKRKYYQIVTDPSYIKCKKVIESCETIEQIQVAKNYVNLTEHALIRKQINGIYDLDYNFSVVYYMDLLFKRLQSIENGL